MNYFQAYLPSLDQAIVAAWESQVAEAAETAWLAQALATRSAELFPRFAAAYAQLRKLPRGARRALQCRLARPLAPEWQRKLAGSLAGAALLLALGHGTAHANDITVETNKPAINSADGLCSLIEAIENANDMVDGTVHPECDPGDATGADRILLPANKTITLTSANVPNYYGPVGLPLINTAITIEGTGGSKIARKKTGPAFRLMAVSDTGDLTLRNVTLSGGRTTDVGGGVFNYGTLTVDNSTITGNKAYAGGAIFNDDYASATIMSNSIISKNTATYGSGGVLIDKNSTFTIQNSTISGNKGKFYGGGITNAGELTIDSSTISGNSARFGGGGLYNDYFLQGVTVVLGTTTISNSTITGNKARFGAGILNDYHTTLTIDNSVVSGNRNARVGGGILNGADAVLTIDNSTISENRASLYGGGIFNDYYYFNNLVYAATAAINNSTISGNRARFGAGILNDYHSTMTVDNSTISGNKGARVGGGILNGAEGILTISNSTISGNTASRLGGGIFNDYFFYNATPYTATATINNSTITGNKARFGGGINNEAVLDLNRSIISGNKARNATSGPEVYHYSGTVTANNLNIFGAGGVDGLAGFSAGAGDIIPAETLAQVIDPLALNAPGTTMTHALPAGSPAIDAIPAANPSCTGTDQRGVARPQGADCDIGAFEKEP
jgi:hypothetical protein